jgi:hypothetical protein
MEASAPQLCSGMERRASRGRHDNAPWPSGSASCWAEHLRSYGAKGQSLPAAPQVLPTPTIKGPIDISAICICQARATGDGRWCNERHYRGAKGFVGATRRPSAAMAVRYSFSTTCSPEAYKTHGPSCPPRPGMASQAASASASALSWLSAAVTTNARPVGCSAIAFGAAARAYPARSGMRRRASVKSGMLSTLNVPLAINRR